MQDYKRSFSCKHIIYFVHIPHTPYYLPFFSISPPTSCLFSLDSFTSTFITRVHTWFYVPTHNIELIKWTNSFLLITLFLLWRYLKRNRIKLDHWNTTQFTLCSKLLEILWYGSSIIITFMLSNISFHAWSWVHRY